MKNFLKYIPLASLFIINVSCKKDFLNVPDKNLLQRELYVTDLTRLNEYMRGTYVELVFKVYSSDAIYPDIVADNIKPTGSMFLLPYTWKQQATEDAGASRNMNAYYRNLYFVIRNCNFVIEKAENLRGQNIIVANSLKGQALALRVLLHWYLINTFAQPYEFTPDASHPGIPYVTSSLWSDPYARLTVKETYDHMVSDLKSAISLIPDNLSDKFSMNLQAAKALLSRVCLYKSDYKMAAQLAREVSMVTPLASGDNYPSSLFTINGTEALFQIPPLTGIEVTYTSYFWAGTYFTSSPGGTLRFVATNDIVNLINEFPNDKRKNWIKLVNGQWEITKFPPNQIPHQFPANAYYQSPLRTSEVYLTAAESYAKLNQEDSARYFLNAIKLRADPSLANSAATGVALLNEIYNERRKETAFEGFRMFDLLRWKQDVKRIDAVDPSAITLPYPSKNAISPIPGSDAKTEGFTQNEGY